MTVEERLTVLERQFAELRQNMAPKKNWIAQVSGSFKNDPDFGEILRLGREIRDAQKPDDDGDALMFIFDSDHLGIIQWQSEPDFSRLVARIAIHTPEDFFVSVVSLHEEFLGWSAYIAKAKKLDGVVKAYDKFLQILNDFDSAQVLPFDDDAAQRFAGLRQQKVRIGTMDLRIAAIALSRSMKKLLSRNLSDFQQVPNLLVEDWTR